MTNPAATAVSQVHGSCLVVKVLTQQLRDHNSVQTLKKVIVDGLQQSKVRNLIINLHDVRMIGSIAFLVLLSVRRDFPMERIVVCEPSPTVREVFQICKMIPTEGSADAPFLEADSLQEALACCGEA